MLYEPWRTIITWNQVVDKCAANAELTSGYMRAKGGSGIETHLMYEMLRYAIDGGRMPRDGEMWRAQILEITTGKKEVLGNPIGTAVACGKNYWAYPNTIITSPFTHNQFAVSSAEMAEHISKYFARELLRAMCWGVGYEWGDVE